jgi:tetratricopeptide (TPR) repeat protein
MSLAAALALLLATASPESLAAAQAAFAAGNYPRAERLALEAGAPPSAEALYLTGLARFRDGRPAEALEAFDRSREGADSPAAWHFNRGACLYELKRNVEAEAEFLLAADEAEFAPLALVNAGFAALDAGATERAATLAGRARAAATAASLPLVEELEQAIKGGAVVGPAPAPAVQPQPDQWTIDAHLEAGWDTDALRASSGALERPGQASGPGSPLLVASAGAAWRGPVLGLTGQASYAFSQLAYLNPQARDRSEQQHDLLLALRFAPRRDLQLETSLFGQYALAGLSELRGLQLAGGARLAGAWDLANDQTSRLGGSFTAKDGLGSEFASLDGSRWEADLSHEVRWERLLVQLGYRLRAEQIGTSTTQNPSVPPGAPLCPLGCAVSEQQPLGYLGQTGWLSARVAATPRLWLDATVGGEWRSYDQSMSTTFTRPDGSEVVTALRQRLERRLTTSATLTWRLNDWLALSMRHDLLGSHSTLRPVSGGATCPPMQPACPPAGDAESWNKQVFTVGASGAW